MIALLRGVNDMSTWEQELGELKIRVEHLETTVRQLADHTQPEPSPEPGQLADQEQLLIWLKAKGLTRPSTAEEQHLATEWETLPEAEKQDHVRLMRSLHLDPPLSQVLSENRR
jgi:hypothetical protein